MKFFSNQRKVLIFVLFIAAAMIGSIWMANTIYKIYIDGLWIVSCAFFAGNGIEHFTSTLNKKVDNKINPPQ